MIQDIVRRAVGFTLRTACNFKFIPYEWNPQAFRFRKASTRHLTIHYVISGLEVFVALFTWFRLGGMLLRKFEPRPFIICFVFALARGIEMVGFYLFGTRRNEIFAFGNALFEAGDQSRIEKQLKQKRSKEKEKWVWDWSSVILCISTFLITINPPVHGLLLIETPCVPHFVSSIILGCKTDLDKDFEMVVIFPLILLETFLIMSTFHVYTFFWTMIYMGCGWVQTEIEKALSDADSNDPRIRFRTRSNWRKIQCLIAILNNAFWYYLIWSPTTTLSISILLFYGIVRFHQVDITNYLMFPACLAHCIFEGYSLLGRSGHVNAGSKLILKSWKMKNHERNKYCMKFAKSCKPLTISAGDLYTFENTIVLTNINNGSKRALTLLVAYK